METKYFNPGCAVDVVIFTIENNSLKILLIKRSNQPFANTPSLPGGFLHKGESTLDAAERILTTKAGVKNVYLEQLYTFDKVDRDPRGQILSVTYFALVPKGDIKIVESENTEKPYLADANSLPKLGFDHNDIVSYAIERLQAKIEYTNIIYSLLPKKFSLTELQTIYEIIIGKNIDKRNFRKKWKELDLLKETSSFSKGGRQRPARLYEFKSKKPAELKKFF